MYLPEHFKEKNENHIYDLVKSFPLSTLLCIDNDEIIANHIPIFLKNKNSLIGHIAKENNLHKSISNGSYCLSIFHGENSYISPNWYPSKNLNHKVVPTWNYQVVHLSGKIFFSDNKKDKIEVIGSLTNYHEKNLTKNKPWKISDAPKEYITMMLDNIVAFEIKVDKCFSKSKLNQNKSKEDFKSVLLKMKENGKNQLYKKMKKCNKNNK